MRTSASGPGKGRRAFLRLNRSCACALAILLVTALAAADVLVGDLSLGNIRFGRRDVPSLQQSLSGSPGYPFMSKVGGVAFNGVAEPLPGAKFSRLRGLSYHPDRPDGERLLVTLASAEGHEVKVIARIPDWQLVPIARYSASTFNAIVTFFGETHDDDEGVPLGSRVINYHDAFYDTLLGLRMLQADTMLFIKDAAASLPSANGQFVLGLGERPPEIEINTQRRARVSEWTRQQARGTGRPQLHDTYVISDLGRQTYYVGRGGYLDLQGSPIWYAGRLYERTKTFEPLEEYSEELTSIIERNDGINPQVYQSLLNTMRFAALFKRYDEEYPEDHSRFVGSLSGVEIQPAVQTPTLWRTP